MAVAGFLHVQSCIKLSQTAALGGKLAFLGEGLAQLALSCGLLVVEVRQLFIGLFQTIRNTSQNVVHAEQITSGVCAQGDTVAHGTLQDNVKLTMEAIEGKLHLEATVAADGNRIGYLGVLADCQDRFTGFLLLCVDITLDLDATEALGRLGIGFHGLDVSFIAVDIAGLLLDLSGEILQELVLDAVPTLPNTRNCVSRRTMTSKAVCALKSTRAESAFA